MPTNSDLLHQYITGEKPAAKSGKETAAAMDAMPKSVNAGNAKVSVADLAAHDKQYHHGHYEGGKCDFRTKNGIPTTAGKNKVVKLASADKPKAEEAKGGKDDSAQDYLDAVAKDKKTDKSGKSRFHKGDRVWYSTPGGSCWGTVADIPTFESTKGEWHYKVNLDEFGRQVYAPGSKLSDTKPTMPKKKFAILQEVTEKASGEKGTVIMFEGDGAYKVSFKSGAKKILREDELVDEQAEKEKAEKIKALQDLHDEYNKWFENSDKSDPSAWLEEDKKWTDKMNAAMKGLVIGKDIQWDADKRNWYSVADGQKKSAAAAKNDGEELVLTEDKSMSDSSGSWKHGKYKDYEVSVANLGEGRFAGYIDIPEIHPLGNYDFENRDTSQFYKIADVPGGITSAGVGRFGWDYENGATDYGDFASLSDEDKEKRVAEDAKKIIDAIEAKRADILKKRIERKETPEFLRFIESEEHQKSFEDETDYVARGKIQPYTDEYLDWCYDYLYGDEPLV